MSVELKIKSKSLEAEAKIIRDQENKILDRIEDLAEMQKPTDELKYRYNCIHDHRVQNVRYEARATFLARAYIRGLPYSVVEPAGRRKQFQDIFLTKIVPRVAAMATKYGKDGVISQEMIRNWADYKPVVVDIETMAA